MALVPVEIVSVGRSPDGPIVQLTAYITCDACGSFDVRHRISSRTSKWITVAVLCAGGLWLLIKDAAKPELAFVCWPAFFQQRYRLLCLQRRRKRGSFRGEKARRPVTNR